MPTPSKSPLFLVALLLLTAPGAASAQDDDVVRYVQALERARTSKDAFGAQDSLRTLGPRAVPVLPQVVKLLDHKEFTVRSAAGQVLMSWGTVAAPAAPLILPRLQDTSAAKRSDAASILARIAPEESRAALQRLARSDPSPLVRRAALRAVVAPEILAEAVRLDSNEYVRQDALDRLRDQRLLGQLAKAGIGVEVTDAIMAKITDREVILDLVKAGPSPLRYDALAKLPSFVVTDIAAKNPDPLVRLDAAWVATDAVALGVLATRDADAAVRTAAGISAKGKPGDLKVTGLDCKPDPKATSFSPSYDCAIQIVNNGVVAYTDLRYVLGATVLSGAASGSVRRLEGSIQPGETREFSAPLRDAASIATNAQFRLVGMRKAAPATP